MGFKYGTVVALMMVIFLMVWLMVKENLYLKMEILMLVNGKRIKHMGKEFIYITMVLNMKANLWQMCNMDLE